MKRLGLILVLSFGVFFVKCSRKFIVHNSINYKIYLEKDLNKSDNIQALDLSGSLNADSILITNKDKLQHLVYLNLSNTGLETISPEVCNMDSLKFLVLSKNKFTFSECFFEMKRIESLSLIGCYLDSIPRDIVKLKTLKVLAVSYDSFTKSDLEFFRKELPNVRVIYSVD